MFKIIKYDEVKDVECNKSHPAAHSCEECQCYHLGRIIPCAMQTVLLCSIFFILFAVSVNSLQCAILCLLMFLCIQLFGYFCLSCEMKLNVMCNSIY